MFLQVLGTASLAEELHPAYEIQDVREAESYLQVSIYQGGSWDKERRIVIQSIRPAFVSNLGKAFFLAAVVTAYKKRGAMGNFIKEAKEGFGLDLIKRHSISNDSHVPH